jgi:sterol desaturase/sphingolipid hydroxylase (fatty acid hydroxylase superfamily)
VPTCGVDLTVAAIPFYFASMEAERRWLQREAAEGRPSPADYTPPDAAASLAMGVGSLVLPLVTRALLAKVLPGKGRYPNVLVRTAAAATIATTVADVVGRAAARRGDDALPRRLRRAARRVARVGGPVAIATASMAASATIRDRTAPAAMWRRNGGRRDLGGGVGAQLAAVAGWYFTYYWNHRFMHEVRTLWAHHVVHHSSERYNLSTALRQPVVEPFAAFLPYGAMAWLGIRPGLIEQARGINLLYQYWIHTDAIRRLGSAEEVLNTPSHHRVHHGSNAEYIDKNHGSILIVWDRLFGTFQREEEPVVYGLTKNIDTFNPVKIAFHEYGDIVRDVAESETWGDRLSFVFRGPGWAYRRHAERAAAEAGAPVAAKGASPEELTAAGVS